MSDFPEFDAAYKTVLVKDPGDIFERLAAEANFNVYHSDIWRGSGRKFAELIVRECIDIVKPTEHHEVWAEDYVGGLEGLELLDHRVAKLKEHFGVE